MRDEAAGIAPVSGARVAGWVRVHPMSSWQQQMHPKSAETRPGGGWMVQTQTVGPAEYHQEMAKSDNGPGQPAVWAWPVGILIGLGIGLAAFGDASGVAIGMGIGIAFALAFSAATRGRGGGAATGGRGGDAPTGGRDGEEDSDGRS
ncbi:hypothetical protein C1I99_20380 [Micromonospora deserti]|uniref:Uncharacterized protein n=2 Tax=Micromonospora deserti TaxID=2070366 RepID=A0A2W2C4U2_9ACTN|nr:hypothetical protein C1I99_20380 [Micromonospora deserti]